MPAKLTNIRAIEILDSRGVPTLQITMNSNHHEAVFSTPSGKSTGKHEAHELRDGDASRYDGQGVQTCIKRLASIEDKLLDSPLGVQDAFDRLLIELDGTATRSHLGGNLMLALSGAYCLLSAHNEAKPLWRHIADITRSTPKYPRIYANLINGGKHAPGLDVQEFMIVSRETSPSIAVEQVATYFHHLGDELVTRTDNRKATLVGDEGGYAPSGLSHDDVWKLLRDLDTAQHFDFACDVAASSFVNADETYAFEGVSKSRADMVKVYSKWDDQYKPLSVEDPFAEDDVAAFGALRDAQPDFFVVGDDITYTNAKRIQELAHNRLIGGVIIKPNQIGTITETLAAIAGAQAAGIHAIVSHRSGETSDSFISDLAYGTGVYGLKIGAPSRGERVAKYNRLLQIEQEVS